MRTFLNSMTMMALMAGATACGTAYQEREITTPSPELGALVEGHNDFAINLYKQGIEGDDNLFFSPFSVSAALGMTYAGARGDTATEMATVLGIDGSNEAYHQEFGALIRDLSGDKGRGYTLHIANRLYGQQDYSYKAEFEAITADDYGAPMERVNFVSDASVIGEHINEWVSEQTQGYIPQLLQPGFVTADTRLVLVNAMYFEADWLHSFDKRMTQVAPFHAASGEVSVPSMRMTETLRSAKVDGASIVELPYIDDEVAMVVVVPDAVDGLAALETDLTSVRLATWIAALSEQETQVQLPKFELEHELPLTASLKAMGMNEAFSPGGADFGGIADDQLFIQDTVHKAFVRVDEVGTKAAAATGVGVGTTSVPQVLPVIADRPFLFVVHDRLSGSVLFMGRVTDPESITIE